MSLRALVTGIGFDDVLPTVFLLLEKQTNTLALSDAGKGYNFYFDSNLVEAKHFIKFIQRVQARYRQIRNVWPEHATLSDVLQICEEALAFRYVDPVAKFITKAEKLHGYMYEWQKVASKEYSAANLFDDLTTLLVSWRKLELTTWAKLFDLEVEKCRNDAKSWFFVAYETIIAASESIYEDVEMASHATNLLNTLQEFFEHTTLGQFEQRIRLLQQFHQHAAMSMQDNNAFKIVYAALDNFIAYISRFERPVQVALEKGRQSLEKDIKDVIKLASWKDTNIEALRQSAKSSHRKLSKLVRKFRALLNRSVSGIVKSSIQEETHLAPDLTPSLTETTSNATVLEVCASNVPGWSSRPIRFQNIGVTVSMMRDLSTSMPDAINGALNIEEMIHEISSSTTELQKLTPATLTEENKETVQHLKTQKRKLYADTMKRLRQMGISF